MPVQYVINPKTGRRVRVSKNKKSTYYTAGLYKKTLQVVGKNETKRAAKTKKEPKEQWMVMPKHSLPPTYQESDWSYYMF